MSFSSPSPLPPSGLNADAARVRQHQSAERAARAARLPHLRPARTDSLHRMVARVRTALRAHPGSR
jgi:ribosomal protein L29